MRESSESEPLPCCKQMTESKLRTSTRFRSDADVGPVPG